MAELRKFMFDDDFEDPELKHRAGKQAAAQQQAEPEPEPEPPPPTFSEEELAIARSEAFAAGRDAGLAEANGALEARIAEAMGLIAATLETLAAAQAQANDETATGAVELVRLIAAKLAPETARRHGTDEIAALVEECLPHLLDQPRIIVRAAADTVDGLQAGLAVLAEANGFEGRLLVMPDAAMQAGDCRVEWADGRAERDMERVWRDIEAIIARNTVGAAERASKE